MPDGKNRNLPERFPVTVVYKDHTEEPQQLLDKNSTIKFDAVSSKESFGLKFEPEEDTFVATPPQNKLSGNSDELIVLKSFS